MTSTELAAWGWTLVALLIASLSVVMVAVSTVLYLRRLHRDAIALDLRALALAAMLVDDATAMATLRSRMQRHPLIGFTVILHLLWLVRGAWKLRLRQMVDDPFLLAICRRWAGRSDIVLAGMAAQVLGLAAHAEDLPLLDALTHRPGPVAGGAAFAILHGWPVDHPAALSALIRLEERRADLLRALLPHFDRDAVQRQLGEWSQVPSSMPLAVFVAGRLDLAVTSEAILAATRHPRAQVRRAACVAVRRDEHRTCLERLADLAERDDEVLVRVAAIQAIGRVPHIDNLAVLRRLLDAGPWLVQSHAVPAILAHGEAGERLLRGRPPGAWRSGAVRWIRELATDDEARP
ncbi:MAG TPA: HEAT repeat domain-containing protein [Planctomycetota bacterium]|nr:HEAT repeat domain-containing protein [Planctomycetota bacterium]